MQRFDRQTLERMERSVQHTERQTPRKHQPFGPDQVGGFYQLIRGRIAQSYTGATGTLLLTNIVPLGENSPYPGTQAVIVNVNRASGSAGTAYAVYHYASKFPGTWTTGTGTALGLAYGTGTGDGDWELFTISGGGGAEGVFGCIFKNIPAASMSLTGSGTGISLSLTHGYGTDAAVLLEVDGASWREARDSGGDAVLYDVANFSKSILRASGSEPVILQGAIHLLEEGTDTVGTGTEESAITLVSVFVPNNWDLRSLLNLNSNSAQIPFKPEGSVGFELGGENCGTGTGTGT